MSKQSLSICMIVKNEEKFLEDCLKSVQSIADQLVIIDTGSTDNTTKIAQKYNAEIHSFEWQDDFSAARNESIKYASGDWILWMDADERLLPETIPELRKILKLEKKAIAYDVQIRNIQADGRNYKISGAHRIFNNNKGIHFNGRVHEQIIHSVAAKGEERKCGVTLKHLGYGHDADAQDKKNQRNRKLLEKMVKEKPGDAYTHYTLAQLYNLIDENARAEKHYKTALQINSFDASMKASLLNSLAEVLWKQKKYSDSEKYSRNSISLVSEQVGGYFMLYRLAGSLNKTEEAVKWLLKIKEKNQHLHSHSKKISTDVLFSDDDIAFELSKNYEKAGRFKDALEQMLKLSEAAGSKFSAKQRILNLSLQCDEYELAKVILMQPEFQSEIKYLDILGIVCIKLQQFEEAVTVHEKLNKQLPGNEQVMKRLAGLYLKIGQEQAYQQLISQLP